MTEDGGKAAVSEPSAARGRSPADKPARALVPSDACGVQSQLLPTCPLIDQTVPAALPVTQPTLSEAQFKCKLDCSFQLWALDVLSCVPRYICVQTLIRTS